MLQYFVTVSKWIGFLLLSCVEYFALYFCIAIFCSLLTFKPKNTISDEADVTIYLRTNGVHLDLVLPIHDGGIDWNEKIPNPFMNDTTKTISYIAFGWGEKNFFLLTPKWSDFKLSIAVKSLFFMGTSAMHVSYYSKITTPESTIALSLTKKQYQNLTRFICDEFRRDKSGNVQEIKQKSYGKYDAFYETKSAYNLFYTCNSWVNSAAKISGQQHCLWTPFSFVLFESYQQN